MMVVACVAIIVVGPKDLPKMLRAFGKTMSNLRRMAGEFQSQFNDAIQESELSDLKDVASPAKFGPLEDARKSMEEFQRSMKEPLGTAKNTNETTDAKPEVAKSPAKPAAKTVKQSAKAKPRTKTTTSKAIKKPSGKTATKPKTVAKAKAKPAAKPRKTSKSTA